MEIEARSVRYLKPGPGGAWADAALDGAKLWFGTATDPHEPAARGDWEKVRQHYVDAGRALREAAQDLREVRDFYTLGRDCLWICFARGHLWWTFAEADVVMLDAPTADGRTRYREAIGGWRCESIAGVSLAMDRLSSNLTQLAGYRRTLCNVAAADYLLRVINDAPDPLVEAAERQRRALVAAIAPVIRQLHWADFELLVDRLIASEGWRRCSRLGGTMPDVDLVAELPAADQRMAIQVKSRIDGKVLERCAAALRANGSIDRRVVAAHTVAGSLAPAARAAGIELWDVSNLAERAVDAGLARWITKQAR